jgi:hypothetical protein
MPSVHLDCSRDRLEDTLTVAIGALELLHEDVTLPAQHAAIVEVAIERLALLGRLIEDCPAPATE